MISFLYSVSIYFYNCSIYLAALFGNKKAKKWISGRKNWEQKLISHIPDGKKPIWFHAASLGEFEQARPLIEKIKEESSEEFIVLSFFSPSGYEVRKDYSLVDIVCYLPIDSPRNAKKFLKVINPKKVLFIKYEFWFNYLKELKKRNIPTYLVSGIFRKKQHFFKFYGGFFRKRLSAFHHFFLQNESSKQLLKSIGYDNCSVIGDTRLDRVVKIAKEKFSDSRLDSFCKQSFIITFGSSWPMEQDFAKKLSNSGLSAKIIIAPHEINKEKLNLFKKQFNASTILWSEIVKDQDLSDYRILVIDQIGLLAYLYRYASIAVIGGGFGSGIHNTMEAAVYGKPIIFGPNYKKFQEAIDLIAQEAAFSINHFEDFQRIILKLYNSSEAFEKSSIAALKYVENNSGATDAIFKRLFH